MRRREVVTGFAGTLAVGLASHGVAETRLPVVGLLAVGRPDGQPSPVVRVIPSALAALGWKDGQNFRLLVREGNGEFDSLEPLMDELLRTPADVIIAASGIVTSRLVAHTRSIPIVMSASGVDPVQAGWAESYARPGSNVTGLTLSNDEAIPKLVQLLKEAAPNMKQLGFLKTRSNTTTTQKILDIGHTAAVAIGIKTHVGLVEDIGEIEGELERLHREGIDALIVLADPVIDNFRERIAEAAIERELPTAGQVSFYAEAGFLLTYAPGLSAIHRRAAIFVDRILRGARPADLPIERPSKLLFTLNLKTARRMNLTVSPTLLSLADEVIE